ncbi:MAG: AtpZ/AtpI family protein [Gemmatimonadaceae bacterium]
MTGEAGGQGRGARRNAAVPSVGEYAGVGLQFALTIVVFMFAGMWLDRTLGTSPWLLVLFVFGGASAGFYSIYRKLTAAQRRAEEARRAAREGR